MDAQSSKDKAADAITDLAVSRRDSESDTNVPVGRIRVVNSQKIEVVELKGPHAEPLKRVLKSIGEQEKLPIDFEEQIVDDNGDATLVMKTKFVTKGDPLYVPAVREALRAKRFPTKVIVNKNKE